MNAQTLAPPLASSDVEQRIESERARLQAEEQTERELVAQRLGPLEAGDDAALDRVEAEITACRERQRRISERIQILETRAEEAKDREHNAELDRLTRRAERAREMGEKLIRVDYQKHVDGLTATLSKLAALEGVIDAVNRTLHANDRVTVHSPNVIRCRPGETVVETITQRVHVNNPLHPHYGNAVYDSLNPSDFATLNGERIPAFTEVEVVRERYESGDMPLSVVEEVVLPGVGPAARGHGIVDLWNKRIAQTAKAGADVLAAEIDAELSGGVIGKVGKAASRFFGTEKNK